MSAFEKRFEIEFENGEAMALEFRLEESGAFDYGNGTQVRVKGEMWPTVIDTRYDTTIKRDGSNFGSWCRRYIDRNYEGIEKIEEVES